MKAAFVDWVFEDRNAIVLEGVDVTIYPPLGSSQALIAAAEEADILLLRDQFSRITASILDACPRLRLVVTRSTGTDHIDLEAARQRGVAVCNVPDYGAHMIAEHAFALMLAVARQVCRGNTRYRHEHRFDDSGLAGVELYGKTLGVIGSGRIGRHTIRIGKGFGMVVLAFDAMQDEALATTLGFTYVTMPRLLAAADFISIHVPLLPETRHLIDADALALVKPGAILVNTARGEVVSTDALKQALAGGRLGGAGLDVLEGERSTYHDFGDLNVVVTPHVAWFTAEARGRIVQIALDNVRAWMAGDTLNRVV